ncbi:MAG: hypothetical protein LEGION0403_FIIPPAGN_02887 [Legionella sp.]
METTNENICNGLGIKIQIKANVGVLFGLIVWLLMNILMEKFMLNIDSFTISSIWCEAWFLRG